LNQGLVGLYRLHGMRKCMLILLVVLPFARAAAQDRDSIPGDTTFVLPPIVVVTRTPTSLDEVPAAVDVLDSTELRQGRRTTGLAESLADLPGTYVSDRGTFALDQRISLRGFGSRSAFGTRGIVVLLDGIPQTLPDGQSQFTNVELADMARVEVLRGSASVLYGNGAGGVVNLISTPAATAPVAGRVRLEGGSHGLFKWHGWGSGRRGPFSAVASLSRTVVGGYREHSAADLRRLALVLGYQDGGTALRLRFNAAHDPLSENPGALTRDEFAASADMAAPNNLLNDAGKAVNQQQMALQFDHVAPGGSRYTLSLFGLLRDLDNPLATNTTIRILRKAGGVRASAVRRVGSSEQYPVLTLGLDLQWMRDERVNLTPNHVNAPDTTVNQLENVRSIGPFLRAVWNPVPAWRLESGVRRDEISFSVRDRLEGGADDTGERSMGAWSVSAGATFLGAEAVTPYLSVSTSFDSPTTTELAVQQEGGGFNTALDPQLALTVEAGARGRSGPIQWSVALFEAHVTDAIVPFEEIDGRSYYTNAGRIRSRGAELGANATLHQGWSVWGVLTGANYRFSDYQLVAGGDTTVLDGHRLAGVPAVFARLGVRGSIGHGWLALEHTLSGQLWADDANTVRVEPWQGSTVRGGWELATGRMQLAPFVGVSNLWNERYAGSVAINGFGGRVFETAAGRSVYAGVEAAF
jgi:iron complex outermembrane receptor protein